jgi:hypothetical protein
MFSSISRDLHVLSVAKYYPTLGKILMYTDVTSSQKKASVSVHNYPQRLVTISPPSTLKTTQRRNLKCQIFMQTFFKIVCIGVLTSFAIILVLNWSLINIFLILCTDTLAFLWRMSRKLLQGHIHVFTLYLSVNLISFEWRFLLTVFITYAHVRMHP